jgi:hypothetical protein
LGECFDKVDFLTSHGIYLAEGPISGQIILGALAALAAMIVAKVDQRPTVKVAALFSLLVVVLISLAKFHDPHTSLELTKPIADKTYVDSATTWTAQYWARGRDKPCVASNLEWRAKESRIISFVDNGKFTPDSVGSTTIVVRDPKHGLADSATVDVLYASSLSAVYPGVGHDSTWSYDYAERLGEVLVPMPFYIRDRLDGSQVWEKDTAKRVPRIQRHSSDPLSVVGLHPDDAHRPAVVAWQCPVAGKFEITATFTTIDGGTTTGTLFLNDKRLDNQRVPFTYRTVLNLKKNDMLKFEVDYTAEFLNLLTGLSASVKQVPLN